MNSSSEAHIKRDSLERVLVAPHDALLPENDAVTRVAPSIVQGLLRFFHALEEVMEVQK